MTDTAPVPGCAVRHYPKLAAAIPGVPLSRVLALVACAAVVSTLTGAALHAQGAPPGDLEVKGAFVLNFIRFVVWEAAPNEGGSDLPVCALAPSDFANAVRQAVIGKSVQNRTISFKIDAEPEPPRCRVVIVDSAQYPNARLALALLRDDPVLTIGNGSGLFDLGGMFELVIEDRKVRFDANLNAIRQSGLHMNPKLLQLSRKVMKQ